MKALCFGLLLWLLSGIYSAITETRDALCDFRVAANCIAMCTDDGFSHSLR